MMLPSDLGDFAQMPKSTLNILSFASSSSEAIPSYQKAATDAVLNGDIPALGKAWVQALKDPSYDISLLTTLLAPVGSTAGRTMSLTEGTDVSSATKGVTFSDIYAKAPAAKAEIDNLADSLANKYGGDVAIAPLKSEERALQKIENEYGGDATLIKDLARNTIIVDSSNVNSVASDLTANGAKVKTISSTTDELGYSGINATIQTKAGVPAEIQVNTPEMIFAKESEENARILLGNDVYDQIAAKTPVQGGLGHTLYEQWRVLLNKNSPEAQAIAEKSRQYYDAVRKANATK